MRLVPILLFRFLFGGVPAHVDPFRSARGPPRFQSPIKLLIALISFLPSASLSGRTLSVGTFGWQSPVVPFFASLFPEDPIANIGRTIHEFDTGEDRL